MATVMAMMMAMAMLMIKFGCGRKGVKCKERFEGKEASSLSFSQNPHFNLVRGSLQYGCCFFGGPFL